MVLHSPILMIRFLWLSLVITTTFASLQDCPNSSNAEYDFIVIGSGAGGGPLASRLADSGFSVLLVDAGHEVVNFNTTLPAYNLRSLEDPQIELNYTYSEYPDGFRVQRDDAWYPRARALGGSTVHNAMINIISGTRQDFDGIASTFNDNSWSRNKMQDYFRRIEHSLDHIPLLSPDHGFDGWLKTSGLPLDVFVRDPSLLDLQLVALVGTLTLAGTPILDQNSIAGDSQAGVAPIGVTVDENHLRSSVHERLAGVRDTSGRNLDFFPDTLATKLLLCSSGQQVSAYGIQLARGAALPVASNFAGKTNLNIQNVTAKYEVIVSAGVFQSPQLLMLSGIGDRRHLSTHNIETIVDLPGVGTNLQDHDEVSVIWRLKNNYTLLNGCTFLSDPERDPCLQVWLQSNHENLYAFAGALDAVISQSSPNLPAPDILTYFAPTSFPGFFRGVPQQVADSHNALTAVVLKAHPSSKGTVRLTGSHPQDRLDIQKLHFQASGGPADLAALRDGIRRARNIIGGSLLLAPFIEAEVSPGSDMTSDKDIEDYILNHVFGHHACCTNPMGPANDPNAVLDQNFKVRGVDRLRVVDASSWPNVPGFFITTPTYMVSEKAADDIIASVRARTEATGQ